MRYIRALVYKIGLRPKGGSIFYSPTRHYRAEYGKAFDEEMRAWKEAHPSAFKDAQ